MAASPALPAGWAISIDSIDYENYAPGAASWDTTCHETVNPSNTLTLQRITLRLTTSDGRVSRFPRSLCRFATDDGRTGVGWTEWNQPPGWPR